ncbi:MAG: type II toxin-antitoxin system VapC family toxin [Pseudonocardia sp.]
MIDASALIELATGRAPARQLVRRTRTGQAAAPELIDLEGLSVVRSLRRRGGLDESAAQRAVGRLGSAPVARMTHRPLLTRVWELRDVVSAYDAAYIALAEQLDVPLLTCDARLGRAHGHDA